MSEGILALLAVIPIAAIFVLMVGFRWPATRHAVGISDNIALAVFVWKLP